MPGRQAWGDDDDDDYLPPRQESAVDSKGVKSIVEYHFNSNGAKVKRTTKVKVFTEHTRVHKSCLERTKWNKFGLAAQVDDNSSYTIKSMEEIKMETPQESREADEKTNISEDTTEGDLRDLFSAFGRINRVYLAKDPETMQSRGFAFVSYYQKSDAESAMQALQGYGYDHLILKLEWAKPSLRDVATEGGLSGMRTSGYGERLAQDTKQQVSYASNLTRGS